MGFEMTRFELLMEPKEYYRNGDRVNCMLIIELVGLLKCKHIFITAIGEVIALFPEQARDLGTTRFMSIPLNLRDLVRNDVLKTGLYRIPFDFYLQNAYLPTFKVRNGSISYYVETIVDDQLFYEINYTTRQEFNVKTHSNRPVASVREKLIRFFGIKIGAVRLSAHMDRNRYFCGEIININFHMNNRSSKTIRFLPQMVRRTAFKKKYIYLESQELIASNYADPCLENSSQSDIVFIPI
ncbi:unnamed protein product, partial [Oppiella nova]